MKKERIEGFDVARSLAIFIMVFVNFETVLAKESTQGLMFEFFNLLHGKGAALFVVLAGAGMSLMLKSVINGSNSKLLWHKQSILLKRALFLFIFGLFCIPFWPADILHFYGFFIFFGVLVANYKTRWLWTWVVILILIYPIILDIVDYDTGWDWKTLEYEDFWQPVGFLRNLFSNGFHPLIPWVAFVFSGIWLGRLDLLNCTIQRYILIISASLFIVLQIISTLLIRVTQSNSMLTQEDVIALFGTQPMPPLPLYMFSAISLSFTIVILCIMLAEKFRGNHLLHILIVNGQLALTLYIGHIIVCLIGVHLFFGENNLSLSFVFWCALIFCLVSIIFSLAWRKRYTKGPLSMLMRYFSG